MRPTTSMIIPKSWLRPKSFDSNIDHQPVFSVETRSLSILVIVRLSRVPARVAPGRAVSPGAPGPVTVPPAPYPGPGCGEGGQELVGAKVRDGGEVPALGPARAVGAAPALLRGEVFVAGAIASKPGPARLT